MKECLILNNFCSTYLNKIWRCQLFESKLHRLYRWAKRHVGLFFFISTERYFKVEYILLYMSYQNISRKKYESKRVKKIQILSWIIGSSELCQFEHQDNDICKVVKLKPFSIYAENFKSITLIVIENLRAQKGS